MMTHLDGLAKVVTAAEMRRLEAAADAAGLPFSAMMERAGRAVASEVLKRVSPGRCGVLVLVGAGNNGGDGLVTAGCLHDAGADVTVALVRARGDSDPHLAGLQRRGVRLLAGEGALLHGELDTHFRGADVIIDAVLGTGAAPPLLGHARQVLDSLATARREPRAAPQLLFCVDLPSGVNADTGEADAVSPLADVTVTFGHAKRGHFLFPGAALVGELVTVDIGIPAALSAPLPVSVTTPGVVRSLLPARPRNANKGTFGRALIVAGSANYIGAAVLAARAAARVGAGLVTLACPASLLPVLASHLVEATYLPLPESRPGHVGPEACAEFQDALKRYTAVLVGPGLGLDVGTRAFLERAVAGLEIPLVLDADGLNAAAGQDRWWDSLAPGAVLTPHPGEMARLTGLRVQQIEADRMGVAPKYAAGWGRLSC